MANRPRPGHRAVKFSEIVIGDSIAADHPVQYQVTPFPPYWHLHSWISRHPGEFYSAPFWSFSDTLAGYADAVQMWQDGCKNRLRNELYSRTESRGACLIHFPRDLNTLIRVSGHPHSPMRTVLKTEHDYASQSDYERQRPRVRDSQCLLPLSSPESAQIPLLGQSITSECDAICSAETNVGAVESAVEGQRVGRPGRARRRYVA